MGSSMPSGAFQSWRHCADVSLGKDDSFSVNKGTVRAPSRLLFVSSFFTLSCDILYGKIKTEV